MSSEVKYFSSRLYSKAGTDGCITNITVGYPPFRCVTSALSSIIAR